MIDFDRDINQTKFRNSTNFQKIIRDMHTLLYLLTIASTII